MTLLMPLTKRQGFPRTGHGNIKQAALFVICFGPATTVQNQHMVKFQALGAMRSQKKQRAIGCIPRSTLAAGAELIEHINQVKHHAFGTRRR